MPLFGSLGGFRKIMGKVIGNDTPANNEVLTFDSASDTWLSKVGGGGGAVAGAIATYTITVDSGTYTATKTSDGSTVSSGTVLETVIDAVLTDKGASNPASIEFGAGTFTATGDFDLTAHENYHIKGQGMGITTIQINSGNTDTQLFNGVRDAQNTVHSLNAVARGDTTVTLTTGTQEDQYAAGDWIKIISDDQIDGADANHKNGEIHQIKSVTTDDTGVITLYSGIITSDWTTPEVVKLPMKKSISYSNFTIDDIRTGVTAQTVSSGMWEAFVVDFNMTNVEFRNCWWGGVGLQSVFNGTIQGCKFYNTQAESVAYDIDLNAVQNVICNDNNHFIDWHGVAITSGGDVTANGESRRGRCINVIVSNSTFQGTFVHSIDTHDGCLYVNIIGNTITSSLAPASDNAMGIRSPSNITGNVIFGGFAAGIFVTNDGKPTNGNGCNISNNHIEGQIKYGIRCNKGVNSFNINSNYIKGADFGGIEFERTDATERAGEASSVKNNYIHGEALRTGNGIKFDSVIDIAINSNYVRECVTGIRGVDTDTRNDFIFVTYNQLDDNTTGINVSGINASGDTTTGNQTMS